ncbi:hypothetical protein NDU88_009965 [Pleurodeles waltl]|uniref:Uncharacterized protein n=1 Tax=Pleurodeles waltl TaxID=8319 RepID=A0AAV7QZ14_PLEWA|nr:hypothetical protein NDU88_009965 [Pleurodeles waltl]
MNLDQSQFTPCAPAETPDVTLNMVHTNNGKTSAVIAGTRETPKGKGEASISNGSLTNMLIEHSPKFEELLTAVLDIKSTLGPKIDALRIDMGHARKDYKKLKEHVNNTESMLATFHPTVTDNGKHLQMLQNLVKFIRR